MDKSPVSIHVPARGTTLDYKNPDAYTSWFQSTFPQGERPLPSSCLQRVLFSFNPRSRKGNDAAETLIESILNVSIHVPARGTTKHFAETVNPGGFQSTFPQGERPNYQEEALIDYGFNPRSRKGNDLIRSLEHLTRDVSIHVPARGTTLTYKVSERPAAMFQSTFPQGERQEQCHS